MANQIPKLSFNQANPTVGFGQITDILIAQVEHPFTSMEKAYLESRIANDSDDPSAVRKLTVIGDKPAPESSDIQISHFRNVRSPKKHTINFRIDENNDQNYAFVKSLEELGVEKVLIWYITSSGKIYGGLSGIEASINIDEIIPESGDELSTLNGTLVWKGNHPERNDNPLSADNGYIDTMGPTAVIVPADGATGISSSALITIEFSEAVRKVGGIVMDDDNVSSVLSLVKLGNPVNFTASILYNKKKIIITPIAALSSGAYTITVAGIEDYSSNVFATTSSTFTV